MGGARGHRVDGSKHGGSGGSSRVGASAGSRGGRTTLDRWELRHHHTYAEWNRSSWVHAGCAHDADFSGADGGCVSLHSEAEPNNSVPLFRLPALSFVSRSVMELIGLHGTRDVAVSVRTEITSAYRARNQRSL